MPSIEDKDVVETLRANSAHKPFGVGVGIRRSERSLDDLGSLGPEDLVEASDVLRVPVTNKNLVTTPSWCGCRKCHPSPSSWTYPSEPIAEIGPWMPGLNHGRVDVA